MDVYVACPNNYVTGGIELLHQLTSELNKHPHIHAKIWYRGNNIINPQPAAYDEYKNEYIVTQEPPQGSVLIFPEIYAWWSNDVKYRNYHHVIYWESVDNYFRWTPEQYLLKFPQGTVHLVQSFYAKAFVEQKTCIPSSDIIFITDYIHPSFFANMGHSDGSSNRVLYNPNKGLDFTQKLMAAAPEIEFIPIVGFNREGLIQLLRESKLYIDFGDHPGKDRLPREAAISGTCVITGKNGSAANSQDVVIPDKYKFERNDESIPKIVECIKHVIDDYDRVTEEFEFYREQIRHEKQQFEEGVKLLAERLRQQHVKYSIIIPTHNAEAYIHKALDSIKSQVFEDYELIVVCDDCTDRTEEIAKSYGAITDRVNFHCDGPTRSRGIDMARGEWLLFMDDDDWWLHEYVLSQIDQKLNENPNIDVLCFSFIFKGWKYADPHGWDGRRWIATWNKCWRREFVGDVRFPNVKMSSDKYFYEGVFAKNPRVLDWDMPMYYYNFMRVGSQTEINRRK